MATELLTMYINTLGSGREGVRSGVSSRVEMRVIRRLCALAVAMVAITVPFTGCSSSQVDSIVISPVSQTLSVGQAAQFTATGVTGHGNHPSSSSDVTDLATWTSSSPAVATVNSSGTVTAVSAGQSTITAAMKGFTGIISSTATVTVTGSGGGTTPGNSDITSVNIIPGSQSVASPGQTSSFIAIGVTSNGATVDLTGQVTWSSSSPQIGTITSQGLATAVSQGTTAITALFTNADKS